MTPAVDGPASDDQGSAEAASSGTGRATGLPGRLAGRLRTWPSPAGLAWFEHRFGLYLVSIAALLGLRWAYGFDLHAFLIAAGDVAAGKSAYAGTLALGPENWGVLQVYVSPPLIAHALAPFSRVPSEAVAVGWTVLGLGSVALAVRLAAPDTLARRMPRFVFSLGYLWAAVVLGQVNLFVLAGLLVALGSRDDRISGFGLAAAILLRGTPAIFALELVFERRWRALAWAAGWCLAGMLLSGGPAEWLTYLDVTRRVSGVATLDVLVQTSLARVGLPLAALAALAAVLVIVLAGRRPAEAALLRTTALGLGLILVPSNSWIHWLGFALVGLLLWGDRALWSRRALAAFLAVSLTVEGWLSSLVAVGTLAAMTWRVVRRAARR